MLDWVINCAGQAALDPWISVGGKIVDKNFGHLLRLARTEENGSLRSVTVLKGSPVWVGTLKKFLECFLPQVLSLFFQPPKVPLIRIVVENLISESLGLAVGRKPAEQECKLGNAEEILLSMLAKLVHWVANNRKFDDWVL